MIDKLKKHEIRIGQIWTLHSISLDDEVISYYKVIRSIPKKRNVWFLASSEKPEGPFENKYSAHSGQINKDFKLHYDPFEAEIRAQEYHKPTRRLARVIED